MRQGSRCWGALFGFAIGVLVVAQAQAQESTSPSSATVNDAAPSAADSSSQQTLKPAAEAAVPQRDVMDLLNEWVLGRRIKPELEGTFGRGLSWSVLPSLSFNPVYGWALGASITGAGVRGASSSGLASVVSISANYSTEGQFQALFRSEVASSSDNYLVKADVRYLDTERATWGLGPFDSAQEEYPMNFRLVRVYGTVYKRASGPVYVGLGYHFDGFNDIVDSRALQGESTPFSDYSGDGVTRTRASAVSINLLADTRDSIVNPGNGYYLNSSFRMYTEEFGSDKYWQEFWVAAQMYPHFPKKSNNILAFWIYSWLTFGPGPYLNLPSVGWDTYGRGARGYLQGRIRSSDQIYLEAEYRFQLTRDGLLGGVVFYNSTASTEPQSKTFGTMDHAGGVGIRIKFNKHSKANLALDRAWGRGGSGGWFMGMSEAF